MVVKGSLRRPGDILGTANVRTLRRGELGI